MTTNNHEQTSQDLIELNDKELDAASGGNVDVTQLSIMLREQAKGRYHVNPIFKGLTANNLPQSEHL